MKYVLIACIVLFPCLLHAAGTGAIDDPYTTVAELNTYIQTSNCASTVYLQSGSYSTGFDMDANCTTGNELVISVSDGAAEDLGGAVFTSGAITVTGQYQTLRGFYLDSAGGVTILGGDNNIFYQCKFEDLTLDPGIFIGKYSRDRSTEYSDAQNNGFQYCTFIQVGAPGYSDSYFYVANRDRYYSDPAYLHEETNNSGNYIQHSVFKNIADTGGGNYDLIQTGAGSYAMLQIESGDTDPNGLQITGNSSGCTMTIASEINVSGSWGGGDWAGYIFAGAGGSSEGTQFSDGETLSIAGDSDCATVVGTTRGGYAERTANTGFTVEYTLFESIDLDNEMISSKAAGFIFRYNAIINCNGAVTLRNGDDAEIYSNFWYLDDTNTLENVLFLRGYRIYGDNQKVYNNYIETVNSARDENCTGAGTPNACCTGSGTGECSPWAQSSYIAVYGGNLGTTRARATNILLSNNTIISDTRFGVRFFDADVGSEFPDIVTLINNIVEITVGDSPDNYANVEQVTNLTCSNNLTIAPSGDDGSGQSGVDAYTPVRYTTNQKSTNWIDWWYPTTYTDGTYNATVTVDAQGQTRANPPDIGMDESGGTDSEIEVGVTWDADIDYVGLQAEESTYKHRGMFTSGGVSIR